MKHNASNFCSNSSTVPNYKCDICNWAETSFCHRGGQYSTFCQNEISIWVFRNKKMFLQYFALGFVPLVTLQPPSECSDVFWTNESEKNSKLFFVQDHKTKKKIPYFRCPRLFFLFSENTTGQWPRKKHMQATTPISFSNLQFVKLHFYFFQLHALYLDNRNTWFTTLLPPWTS